MQSTSPLLNMKPLPLLLPALALVLAGGGLWWMSRSSDPLKLRPASADTRPRAQSSSERLRTALRTALRDTDRGRRSARFATVWSGLTAAEAAVLAPELLAHEAGSPFQNDWLDFLERWGALDSRAALAFAAARGGDLEWLEPLKDLFSQNAALMERVRLEMTAAITDSQPPQPGAKEWFLWLVKPENRPVSASPFMEPDFRPQEAAFRHWLAADPEESSRWLRAQEPSATRDGLARVLVLATADEDPVAAQEWLRSMSPENRRTLYLNWPSHSIPASLDWIVEFMKADGFHPEAFRAR